MAPNQDPDWNGLQTALVVVIIVVLVIWMMLMYDIQNEWLRGF